MKLCRRVLAAVVVLFISNLSSLFAQSPDVTISNPPTVEEITSAFRLAAEGRVDPYDVLFPGLSGTISRHSISVILQPGGK